MVLAKSLAQPYAQKKGKVRAKERETLRRTHGALGRSCYEYDASHTAGLLECEY